MKNSWLIKSVAHTESREAGDDIRAERDGQILIVEAKGYPSETYERGPSKGSKKRTAPSTQARHWLGEVIFTAMLRQNANPEAKVAIALPYKQVYLNLLDRLEVSLKKLGISTIIVREEDNEVIFLDGSS